MIYAYVGLPGTGKTLSMIHAIAPRVKAGVRVYTNTPFEIRGSKNQPIYLPNKELLLMFQKERNATFLIDEGHIVFRAYSWGKIDYSFLDKFGQGRKLNLDLFLTAQRFTHILARLRELTNYVIVCKRVIQKPPVFRNIWYDPEIYDKKQAFDTPMEKKYILKRAFVLPWEVKKVYKMYDTNFIIESFSAEDLTEIWKRQGLKMKIQNVPKIDKSVFK